MFKDFNKGVSNTERNISLRREIIFSIVMIVIGSLFHSLYTTTKFEYFLPFFPSNESVWEHLKLVLIPYMIIIIFEVHYYGEIRNYFFSKFMGILSAMFLITVFFYLYTYFTGESILFLDISIFIGAVLLSSLLVYVIQSKFPRIRYDDHFKYAIITMFIIFVIFTFLPLNLEIFTAES